MFLLRSRYYPRTLNLTRQIFSLRQRSSPVRTTYVNTYNLRNRHVVVHRPTPIHIIILIIIIAIMVSFPPTRPFLNT